MAISWLISFSFEACLHDFLNVLTCLVFRCFWGNFWVLKFSKMAFLIFFNSDYSLFSDIFLFEASLHDFLKFFEVLVFYTPIQELPTQLQPHQGPLLPSTAQPPASQGPQETHQRLQMSMTFYPQVPGQGSRLFTYHVYDFEPNPSPFTHPTSPPAPEVHHGPCHLQPQGPPHLCFYPQTPILPGPHPTPIPMYSLRPPFFPHPAFCQGLGPAIWPQGWTKSN